MVTGPIRILRRALIASLLLFSWSALAQDTSLAKREYDLGWKDLKNKRYSSALDHYQRSYAEVPRPRTMYNIAVCEEELGRFKEAIRHYQKFLANAEARDATNLSRTREKLAALRSKIGAVVLVKSIPSKATVRVNDVVKGHTPLRLDLLAGEHQVRVSHKGTRSSERRIVVRPGDNAVETFALDRVGSVILDVKPVDALIRRMDVDDVARGHYEAELSPGSYEFELSLAGYSTRTITMTVEESSNQQKTINLKAHSTMGTLNIRSDLSGANVTIDGVIVGSIRRGGREIPTIERRLVAGNHVVIVEAKDRPRWSKRFHLSPGETLAVDLRYKSESTPRKVARLGLTGVGTAALLAGIGFGVGAISDRGSDDLSRTDRGRARAGTAKILLGVGALGLAGAWYLGNPAANATTERSHEGETNSKSISLRLPGKAQ